MPESLYRRDYIGSFVSDMVKRNSQLTQLQGVGGKSAVSRDPAYIYITGVCKKCGKKSEPWTLPEHKETWDTTYKPKFKPGPTVKSVKIDYGGEWGLAQKISATIECYIESDFKRVCENFLYPGNSISVKFGYGAGDQRWQPTSKTSIRLENFRTAVFSFDTTPEGGWLCNFTAVSSATALKSVDILHSIGDGSIRFIDAGAIDGPEVSEVHSIMELIEADCQRDGQFSVQQMADGQVFTKTDFQNYTYDGDAAIVVYDGKYILGNTKSASSMFSIFHDVSTAQTGEGNKQIYVTLGYVVNRIVNDQLLKAIAKNIGTDDQGDFKKLKIKFHKDYSKASVPRIIRSGNPLDVLLLGQRKGNYKGANGGKDFEDGLTNPSVVTCAEGDVVDIKKILINKNLIKSALAQSTKTIEAVSDTTGVKDTKEEVISLPDFFKKLFDGINDSVGGALALRLVEDVEDKERNTLLVVDQNTGGDKPLPCIVLNPRDGDGSTRVCTINSNVGSEEFKASMFVGLSKKGDSASVLRECDTQMETSRATSTSEATKIVGTLIFNPGVLGKSKFDGKHIDALKSAMSTLFKNRKNASDQETVHWPGMKLSAVIDGTWGIIPGCAISSTQLLSDWRNKGLYFMVTNVVHTFENSDWSTSIEGIMAYYKKLKPIILTNKVKD